MQRLFEKLSEKLSVPLNYINFLPMPDENYEETESFDKFDVFFVSLPDQQEEKISIENIEKLSADHHRMPVLIKRGKDIFLFGNTDGTDWQLTPLAYDTLPDYAFQSHSFIAKDRLSNRLFRDIAAKKAHSAKITVLINLAGQANYMGKQLRNLFNDMLEPKAFAVVGYPSSKTPDRKEDEAIFYYKNCLQIIKEIAELLKTYEALHLQFLEVQKRNYRIGQTITVISHRKEIEAIVDQLFLKQKAFDDSLARLGLDQIELRLPNLTDFKQLLQFFLPTETIYRETTNNPFYKNISELKKNDEQKASAYRLNDMRLLTMIQKLDTSAQKTCSFLERFACKNELDEDARKMILESFICVKSLLKEVDAFSKTDKSIFATLNFAYQIRSDILNILAKVPEASATVKSIIHDALLETLEQINIIFREITLHFDRIELRYHIKEGYFSKISIHETSLETLEKAYQDWINKMGFRFLDDISYPYTESLLKQREDMLNDRTLSEISQLILNDKIESAKKKLRKARIQVIKNNPAPLTAIDLAMGRLRDNQPEDETTFYALCYLRGLLASGYRLKDALNEIREKLNEKYFLALNENMKITLENLETIDKTLTKEQTKTLIHYPQHKDERQETPALIKKKTTVNKYKNAWLFGAGLGVGSILTMVGLFTYNQYGSKPFIQTYSKLSID